jgi:hypothetical protein
MGDRVRNRNPRYRTGFVVETLEMTKGGPNQGRIGVHYEASENVGYADPASLRKISRHKAAK